MKNATKIMVAGRSVSYADSGKNTVPLIFLHGFPFNKSTWQLQFDFLKDTQRVILYDLPGFGDSAPLQEEASIALYADHLIALMDALHLEKAMVCGLSMGGYILLNAAERYQQRFSAIILSDTQCLADSKENAQKRYDTIDKIKKEGLEDFAEGFLKNLFSEKARETKKELVAQIKKMILSTPPGAVTAALKAMAGRKETCSGLRHIQLPALVLCGEEDTLTPYTQSEFLFNNLPNSELHIIHQAGHLSNLEQADEFNGHLHNFISDIIL